MSEVVAKAMEGLAKKLGNGFDGVAKLVIEGEGAIMVDATGVHAGDEEADVTLTASADVFAAIFAGEMGATGAYMSGKLKMDGSIPTAMRLGAALA